MAEMPQKIKDLIIRLGAGQILEKLLLIAALLILVYGFGVQYFLSQAYDNAADWLGHEKARYQKSATLQFAENFTAPSNHETKRLQEQFQSIRERARIHLEVMIYYYTRYYMAISLTMLCGAAATIALLFISKRGWANANAYVVIVFIVMTSAAGMFGAFPTLFEHKKNIDENKSLFLSYVALENRVLSYVATGENTNGEVKTLKEYIHTLDEKLESLHKLPIEFDPESIPDLKTPLQEAAN